MKRPVSSTESYLVAQVAARLPETEQRQILSDLAASVAEPLNPSETIIEFHISGYERPVPREQKLYPIEGRTLDQDGSEVIVLVYADSNGRLLELEVLRVLPGPLIGPNWNALEFY